MKVRNESLDCLKGIAILLVMFGHVQVHNQMTDPYLYDVIKSLQMPLFFLISGYLAGAGTKILDPAQYRDRMRRRAAAYLLPFSPGWRCSILRMCPGRSVRYCFSWITGCGF